MSGGDLKGHIFLGSISMSGNLSFKVSETVGTSESAAIVVGESATVEVNNPLRNYWARDKFLSPLLKVSQSLYQVVVKQITRPPGTFLDRLAEFVCTKRTYEHVLRTAISDMQWEYFEALAAGRKWKSRWIRLRGYWAFWRTWARSSIVTTAIAICKLLFK
jgi:hypothetical protein